MIIRRLAAAFALVATVGCASAGVCHYENLMPAFLAFEKRTENLPPAKRADLFVSEFAARHPEFYGESDFQPAAKLRKDALRLLDPAHLEAYPGFPPLTQVRLDTAARATGPDFDAAQTAFLRTFRDFRCDELIAFGPSFLHFDGHGYTDKRGWMHMLFGVDVIVLIHRQSDIQAFYTHELFHLYHHQVVGRAYPKDDSVPWWAMWEEGLATYASQRLNPGLSAQQVLWFPTDLVARMEAPGATVHAARQLLADFDKASTYSHWFETGSSVPGLPARAGYYMGYRLVASLGRDHSLKWLAHLPPDRVKRAARDFLARQARGG